MQIETDEIIIADTGFIISVQIADVVQFSFDIDD